MARLNCIALLIVATSVLTCVLAQLYSELDDQLDVPKILANDAERQGIVDCLLKKAPCTELQQKCAGISVYTISKLFLFSFVIDSSVNKKSIFFLNNENEIFIVLKRNVMSNRIF